MPPFLLLAQDLLEVALVSNKLQMNCYLPQSRIHELSDLSLLGLRNRKVEKILLSSYPSISSINKDISKGAFRALVLRESSSVKIFCIFSWPVSLFHMSCEKAFPM
jgi:hypothetical protein